MKDEWGYPTPAPSHPAGSAPPASTSPTGRAILEERRRPGQRAMIAVHADGLKRHRKQAAERQQEGGRRGGKMAGRGRPPQKGFRKDLRKPKSENGEARQQAAKEAGTNRQYVQDAEAIRQEAPELVDDVIA